MRFMMLVKASKDQRGWRDAAGGAVTEMGDYNEELSQAGVLLDANGLHPTSKGWRIAGPAARRP